MVQWAGCLARCCCSCCCCCGGGGGVTAASLQRSSRVPPPPPPQAAPPPHQALAPSAPEGGDDSRRHQVCVELGKVRLSERLVEDLVDEARQRHRLLALVNHLHHLRQAWQGRAGCGMRQADVSGDNHAGKEGGGGGGAGRGDKLRVWGRPSNHPHARQHPTSTPATASRQHPAHPAPAL